MLIDTEWVSIGSQEKDDYPSLTTLKRYCEEHLGLVSVLRHKGMTAELGEKFSEAFTALLPKAKYSEERRSYVHRKHKDGNFYSDSITVGLLTIRDKCKLPIGSAASSLSELSASDLFETIDVQIADGQIQNAEVLQKGDCLLFKEGEEFSGIAFVFNTPGRIIEFEKAVPAYKSKDITSKLPEDVSGLIRVAKDLGDGWSVCIQYGENNSANVIYIQNDYINSKCSRSQFIASKIEYDCWMKSGPDFFKNNLCRMRQGMKVSIISHHKKWCYVRYLIHQDDDEVSYIDGWVKSSKIV